MPALAAAQTIFPSTANPLPNLTDEQIGTAGTTTITRNTQGPPGPAYFSGARPAGTALDLDVDPNADPTVDADAGDLRPARGASAATTGPAVSADEDLDASASAPLDAGAEPIDSQEAPRQPDDPTGIRLGSFMLRPSVNQSINTEITRSNGAKDTRNYLATGIRGTLSSDWSRHALTVTGDGVFETDLRGGDRTFEPEGTIAADLRLDFADDTVAHVTGGYSFTREDTNDPNAVGGGSENQAGVHQFTGGLSVERDLGRIKGLAALEANRSIYTDAKLADGGMLSMADRDRTGVDGRLRLGYELSTALVPFVEVATGHTFYDQTRDNAGYARSSQTYAGRTGVQFDFGDKLRGEVGTGYQLVDYDDSRLDSVGGLTLDGQAVWSPRRGTDVSLGLRTTVQDSTTAGQSGWVEYQLTSALAHQMRDNVTGRLTGGTTLRDFQGNGSGEDEITWVAGVGVTWAINRYLDLTSDVEYERTSGGSEQNILRAGVGLTVKR
jgi:hypothetical protein